MKVLLLNQCFYPDVMATAQQLTHLAVGWLRKGTRSPSLPAIVVTMTRPRALPDVKPGRESTIIRIPSLALGKQSRWRRAVTFASFLIICSCDCFCCQVLMWSSP